MFVGSGSPPKPRGELIGATDLNFYKLDSSTFADYRIIGLASIVDLNFISVGVVP